MNQISFGIRCMAIYVGKRGGSAESAESDVRGVAFQDVNMMLSVGDHVYSHYGLLLPSSFLKSIQEI